jgi:uncharacterized protein with FMN-binding domain
VRRAPVVISATVAGLVGVLAFHTRPSQLSLATVPAAGTTQAPATAASPAGQATARSSAAPTPGKQAKQASGAERSATGSGVNYNYGILSVRVTVSGHKILKVGIASIDDGGNPRSQYIDQQAIPVLEQEVMKAQSGSIQGVSGASYTSAGFVQSLQAALHDLGFQ